MKTNNSFVMGSPPVAFLHRLISHRRHCTRRPHQDSASQAATARISSLPTCIPTTLLQKCLPCSNSDSDSDCDLSDDHTHQITSRCTSSRSDGAHAAGAMTTCLPTRGRRPATRIPANTTTSASSVSTSGVATAPAVTHASSLTAPLIVGSTLGHLSSPDLV